MTTSDVAGVFRSEARSAIKLYYFDIPGKVGVDHGLLTVIQ